MTSDARIAWAAGVFEGEGSIVLGRDLRPGRRVQRHLKIAMTDRDVLEKVQQAFGAGTIYDLGVRRAGYKRCFAWVVGRWKDIERVLQLMLPWLCARRRVAALRLLEHPAGPVGSPKKTHCKRGHPLSGPGSDVYVWESRKRGTTARHCLHCHRLRLEQYAAPKKRCVECRELRPIAAQGRCFRCYRRAALRAA